MVGAATCGRNARGRGRTDESEPRTVHDDLLLRECLGLPRSIGVGLRNAPRAPSSEFRRVLCEFRTVVRGGDPRTVLTFRAAHELLAILALIRPRSTKAAPFRPGASRSIPPACRGPALLGALFVAGCSGVRVEDGPVARTRSPIVVPGSVYYDSQYSGSGHDFCMLKFAGAAAGMATLALPIRRLS
jgi:hypothetical protein